MEGGNGRTIWDLMDEASRHLCFAACISMAYSFGIFQQYDIFRHMDTIS